MPNTLFLRLEGPLQSWGERGQWGVRDSAPEPTKSGIVGLLGCALGWRDDEALRGLSDAIRIAVRCDRPGILLTDYHTVGGGYDIPQLLEARGKPKWTPGGEPHTELTWRDYLCDASFLVVVQGAGELIAQLAAAVREPVWPVYLGRKACVPSVPIYEGEGDAGSPDEALRRPWRSDRLSTAETLPVRAVIEVSRSEGVRRPHRFGSRSRRPHGFIYMTDRLFEVERRPLIAEEEGMS